MRISTTALEVELIPRLLVGPLCRIGFEGDEKTSQLPARGGLGQNFGFQVGAVFRADQVQM